MSPGKSNGMSFIQHSPLETAGLGLGIASTTEVRAADLPGGLDPEVTYDVDVLVVGGGTAGHVAAIQAGRAGATVLLVEEKCEQAGVRIAYYEFPEAVKQTGDGWQVDCVGFGTRRRVRCKQIIDCTGGAEVVGLAGLPRLREDERQPGSYLYMLGEAHEPGRNQIHRLYVHGADSTNSRTVTHANLTGRKSILKTLREKKGRLMHLQPETGFRESYRIEGETLITLNDYRSGRRFDDDAGRESDQRLYYYNKETWLASDLTTEAALTPDKWGKVQVGDGTTEKK
jgi:hypothetical protein